MLSKAVFLDKDGTLVEDVPYNINPDRIHLMEGALEGLSLLQKEGYRLIVVTNQSGIARGYFQEQDLEQVEMRLKQLLQPAGIHLDGFYHCPHHPDGSVERYAVNCICRKPWPGMLNKATLELGLDMTVSWLVGDILNDIEAGNRAGCRTVLLDNAHETEWELTPVREPTFAAKNLYEAACTILREGMLEGRFSHGER
jgi:D-glycero-D-manno-heptose 1,7-bisphosphate phosphatase